MGAARYCFALAFWSTSHLTEQAMPSEATLGLLAHHIVHLHHPARPIDEGYETI